MTRFAAALIFCLLPNTASIADEIDDVLRLWATQSGDWLGKIDIYSRDMPNPLTVDLQTTWASTPDGKTVTKIETFIAPQGQNTSVTVMFEDATTGNIVTPYFTNGEQRDYYFSVVSASKTDDANWTTIIASPDEQEIYEDRPAVLRYVRTRAGNSIINTKEVNFFDDEGDETYALRSYIEQTLIQPATSE